MSEKRIIFHSDIEFLLTEIESFNMAYFLIRALERQRAFKDRMKYLEKS